MFIYCVILFSAIGVHFNNLFSSASEDPADLCMGIVYLMLLFDMLIYGIITLYIDNVLPGPYGRAKPWHFIFSVSLIKFNFLMIMPTKTEASV